MISVAFFAPRDVTATETPLPAILNGVSVVFYNGTFGGRLLASAPLLRVGSSQIRAILPSSLPIGTIQLGLLVDGVDVGQDWSILVIGSRFAPFSQNWMGFGPALIQQRDRSGNSILNRLTTPAAPGSIMTLWGTGLGPLPAGIFDAEPSTVGVSRSDINSFIVH